MNKITMTNYAVEYIRNNQGCTTEDIKEFFLQKKRADGLPIKYTPSSGEMVKLLLRDKRVYNENRGMHNVMAKWHVISGVEGC